MVNRTPNKIAQTPEEFGQGLALGLFEITDNIRQRIYEYGIQVSEKEVDNIEQAFILVYLSSSIVAITVSDDIPERLKGNIVAYFDKCFTSNMLDRKKIEFVKDLKQKFESWSQQLVEIIINPPEQPTLNIGRLLLKIAGNQSSKFNDIELIGRLTVDFCIAVHVINEYVSNVLTTYAVMDNHSG